MFFSVIIKLNFNKQASGQDRTGQVDLLKAFPYQIKSRCICLASFYTSANRDNNFQRIVEEAGKSATISSEPAKVRP